MKITFDQYERMLRFMDFKMSTGEMEDFLKELKENPAMRERLKFEQSVRNYFEQELVEKKITEEQFPMPVSSINSPGAPPAAIKTKPSRPFYFNFKLWSAIAASVVIVAGIIWFSPKNPGKGSLTSADRPPVNKNDSSPVPIDTLKTIVPPQQDVNYSALYERYKSKDNPHGPKPRLLADVLDDYENEEYKTLQNLNLDDLLTRSPDNIGLNSDQNVNEIGHYYIGLAFLQSDSLKNALVNLQWVIDSAKNKELVVKANWYRALLYLKEGNVKKAVPLLTMVSKNKATKFNQEAKELLQDLKK